MTIGYRRLADQIRRTAWAAGLPYRPPDDRAPDGPPIVTVLGMHRSGTSAAVGILEDHGFTVPAVAPKNFADNKLGTRESGWLVALSNNVLWLNAASWCDPPERPLRYLTRHIASRNRIVGHCVGGKSVLKDPRMLLMLDLWQAVNLTFIGVVRNPMDVSESLTRRDGLSQRTCIALWKRYNAALLRVAESEQCPIAMFDQPQFPEQIARCMSVHGYRLQTTGEFFDDSLIRSRTADWRELIRDDDAVALYDKLEALSLGPMKSAVGPSDARPGRP